MAKLDHESLRQWEIHISGISSAGLPTWDNLVVFLESRFRTLEMIDSTKQASRSSQQNVKRMEKVKTFATINDDRNVKKNYCLMCSGDLIKDLQII